MSFSCVFVSEVVRLICYFRMESLHGDVGIIVTESRERLVLPVEDRSKPKNVY